jgi:multisubunit Na+/H+ antiporter MnhB subunit
MIKLRDIVAVIVLIICTIFLIFSVILMHPFANPTDTTMDDYIISNAQNETGANNAVTSVVFDYRGFDTLGEATVLFTAVAAVMMLFRRRKNE